MKRESTTVYSTVRQCLLPVLLSAAVAVQQHSHARARRLFPQRSGERGFLRLAVIRYRSTIGDGFPVTARRGPSVIHSRAEGDSRTG